MSWFLGLCIFAVGVLLPGATQASKQPNIVVIMTDDQDWQLGSTEVQPALKRHLVDKGITLDKHFVTTAQCCPSRTSFLRGQAAHNTNLTNVRPPGGAYEKFVASGEVKDYLPMWLSAAGYQTEYIGKFLNGYSMATYDPAPEGWDHTDILVNPYTYNYNNVVMSMNGQRPIFYDGFHQTDIMRAKALDRLQYLVSQPKPFYIQIAPTAPHVDVEPPVPCVRHMWSFNNVTAPRTPNFNPSDDFQKQKPGYLKDSAFLNQSQVDYVDYAHRARLQSLLGIDEMVDDITQLLEEHEALDNTYVIYTTDNGYHLGNHRRMGGKGLPYIEDTNVPMIIRGPGIPEGVTSQTPSAHLDMAPTFLDMAGVSKEELPAFLDGRSLLTEWLEQGAQDDNRTGQSYVAKEVLNIEFWGTVNMEAGSSFSLPAPNNSYKSVRLVNEESSWLFSRWCMNNDTELYNTKDDPYELTNLALNPDPYHLRIVQRLNGLLLVTKSCSGDSCRNPWATLADFANDTFSSLNSALDPRLDAYFADLPQVGFQTCLQYQSTENEAPYYPPAAAADLGSDYRETLDDFVNYGYNLTRTPGNSQNMGTAAQRYANITDIMFSARNVTDAEIGMPIACPASDMVDCAQGDGS